MKNTILFLVFIASMIASWLLFSILWNFFDTNHTYIEVLRCREQIFGFMLLYWWCPGFIIVQDLN